MKFLEGYYFVLILFLYYHPSSQVVYSDSAQDYYTSDDYEYDFSTIDDSSYLCKDKHFIIPISLMCDGFPDCDDQSDEDADVCNAYGILSYSLATLEPTFSPVMELNAVEKQEIANCDSNEFECPRNLYLCVPLESICDGFEDCPGGEDEENCESSLTEKNYSSEAETFFEGRLALSNNSTNSELSLIHRLANLSPRNRQETFRLPSSHKRLSFQAPPIASNSKPLENNLGFKTAGFHQVLRQSSKEDLHVRDNQPVIEEAGESRTDKYISHLSKLTDEEAEEFLLSQFDLADTSHKVNSRDEQTSHSNHVPRQRNIKPNFKANFIDSDKKFIKTGTSTTSTEKDLIKDLVKKLIRKVSKSVRSQSQVDDLSIRIQFEKQNSKKSNINWKQHKNQKIKITLQFVL